ncbi:MAG: DUF4190 domain-containing protein [Bifidobacteriaceae bacterium]|jgi:peptidyl-prolyl cis-trans isomerase B (cyclophilin B)|nr:DUF4190 domain-containing protein [Bifidobacteriaceae bacterium]
MSQYPYGPAQDPVNQTPPPVTQAPPPYGVAYPQPYVAAYPMYVQPARPTNGMAIAALVLAFFFPPLAIVFGHIARGQIRRTGESGDGLALAGLIMGYIFTSFLVIYIIFIIGVVIAAA